MVFLGFGIAFVHKFWTQGIQALARTSPSSTFTPDEDGETVGLKGAAVGGELSPEMLGVGYLIGPRIACMMMAGAVLSYFVIGPLIATFGEELTTPCRPATKKIDEKTDWTRA